MSEFVGNGLDGIRLNDCECNDCTWVGEDGQICSAFLNEIPKDILLGEVKHRKPYKDKDGKLLDNGIQFKAREE